MNKITVDITDISKDEWIYQVNHNDRRYRQNVLVLKLREAGIPAEGVKAFQGVWKGTHRIEITDDDRQLVVWEEE